MANRKASIFIQPASLTSLNASPRESDMRSFSFRDWHMRMQNEHERLEELEGPTSFKMWKWCYKGCRPCRWFDSIRYQTKICKCCLTFETFKTLGTIILIGGFSYMLMYTYLDDEVLPGGTVFFLFFLFFTAYLAGYVVMLAGLPPMLGNLVIGLIFGNIPPNFLPPRDDNFVAKAAKIAEEVLLITALIRAGLLLDLSRIKSRILFILRLSLFPFSIEFILVLITSHFLLKLPWDWSALQGSITGIVSLASVTSVMEKNKVTGYGEDIHLSTILIAASALNVVNGLIVFSACVAYLFPEGRSEIWMAVLNILKEIAIGLGVGIIGGLLVAFFPDKRNRDAAALRIVVIGIGSFAIANILRKFGMQAAGAISCLTLCITATNMWEELGWHQHNNPVQYFYTMVYYIGHPVVLSLLGFTMNFRDTHPGDIGLSLCVILIGLIGRGTSCFVISISKSYPTTVREKIYICITWLSKGTFQALLAFTIKYIIEKNKKYLSEATFNTLLGYIERIKRTTILSILFTTPIVCFTLTFLTPKLLTKRIGNSVGRIDLTPETLTKETVTRETVTKKTKIPTLKKMKK